MKNFIPAKVWTFSKWVVGTENYSIWGIFENHVNYLNPQDKIELMNAVDDAAYELFIEPEVVKKT